MEIEWRDRDTYGGEGATRLDGVLGRLAAAHHGVVRRRDLLAAGVSARSIERCVAGGRLVALFGGVWAVGHTHLRLEGVRLAAVWAGGADAVLSHRSAAEAHGLIADARTGFDITVPPDQARGRSDPRLILHRTRLSTADRTTVDEIPCTSIPRTLVDLGATRDRRLVARAVNQAMILEVYDQTAVDEVLRRPGRLRGVAVLRGVLEDRHPDAQLARSVLEAIAIERLEAAGVTRAAINVWLPDASAEVDLLWKKEQVIVELDGRRYHAHRRRQDRERDALLESLGYRVLRYGWGDVTAGPFPEQIRAELSRT